MATVKRLASFWKAFFAVLLGSSLASAASRGEIEAWESAKARNTADGYYLFLSLYPAGDFVTQALSALARLGTVGPPRGLVPTSPAVNPPGGQGGSPAVNPPGGQGGGGPYK